MMYNVCVMYRAMGDRENAKQWLEYMDEKYEGNYKTQLMFSLIEIDEQEYKSSGNRSYRSAYDHYLKATSLYTERSNKEVDGDMEMLEGLIEEIKEYGWI
jgi:hypothetical protein